MNLAQAVLHAGGEAGDEAMVHVAQPLGEGHARHLRLALEQRDEDARAQLVQVLDQAELVLVVDPS